MGDFDDVVESQRPRDNKRVQDRAEVSEGSEVSLMELIANEESLGGLAGKINPELRGKVLVPLANILDKYGMSDKIATSDTTQSTVGLLTLLTDIAPVIKGLTEYISGQRNALSEEDKLFLEQIKEAQETGEFSDLFTSEEGSTQLPPEDTPSANYHPLLGEMPEIDITGKINWMDIVDPDGAHARGNLHHANDILNLAAAPEEQVANLNFFNNDEKFLSAGMVSLEDLALEAGVGMEKVMGADTQIRNDSNTTIDRDAIDELVGVQTDMIDLIGGDLIDDIMESTAFSPQMEDDDEIIYLTENEVAAMRYEGVDLQEVFEDAQYESPQSYPDSQHDLEEEFIEPVGDDIIENNYADMTISTLKGKLRAQELRVGGNKNELIARLREFDRSL